MHDGRVSQALLENPLLKHPLLKHETTRNRHDPGGYGLNGVYSLSLSLPFSLHTYSGRFLGETKTKGNVLVFPESMPIHRP